MHETKNLLIQVPDAEILQPGEMYPNLYRPIPANGKACHYTGLKHARLYKLLNNSSARKTIRVVQLRDPGAAKGVTLYHVGDLMLFLDRLAAQQGSGSATGFGHSADGVRPHSDRAELSRSTNAADHADGHGAPNSKP